MTGTMVTPARFCAYAYYIVSIFLSERLMMRLSSFANNDTVWDFLWPLWWIPADHADLTVKLLGLGAFLASLVAALFANKRLARGVFAIVFFLAATVENSRGGGINHPYHAWILVGFLLVLLPDRPNSDQDDKATIFYVQALLALFYTMSGFWKVGYGVLSALAGVDGAFSLVGLSHQVAFRVLQTNESPLLADFVINNPLIAWLGMLGVMYVQLLALVMVFRPVLHVPLGLALIFFHLGTFLLLEILFMEHVALLAIFFLFSPFRPEKFVVRDALLALPGVGLVQAVTGKVIKTLQPSHKPAGSQ